MTKNKFNIVNIIAGVNVILLIGLALLYLLYFTTEKHVVDESLENTGVTKEIAALAGDLSIVYIDSDRILDSYYLADVLRKEFESEKRRLENDFVKKQRKFQQDVEDFQRRVQLGTITMDRAQQLEQELMLAQQELYELNESYSERLIMREMEMQKQLTDSISEFLTKYNKDKNYHFILGYARGGGILYASPELDITDEVIKELEKVSRKK